MLMKITRIWFNFIHKINMNNKNRWNKLKKMKINMKLI